MSAAAQRIKQSTEKRTLSFDFLGDGYGAKNCKLKTGDTVLVINSCTASPASDASTITLGSPSLGAGASANVVSVQASGGTHGNTYFVQCNITTTPGADILELDGIVVINDHEN